MNCLQILSILFIIEKERKHHRKKFFGAEGIKSTKKANLDFTREGNCIILDLLVKCAHINHKRTKRMGLDGRQHPSALCFAQGYGF